MVKKQKIKRTKANKEENGGRQFIPIDWEEVGRLLMAGCSGVQIALAMGFTAETLYERCVIDLGKSFSVYSCEKKSKGDNFLRTKQMQVASKGNTTMLVWLGKQRLGQKDVPTETQKFNGKLAEFLDYIKNVKDKEDFKKEEN